MLLIEVYPLLNCYNSFFVKIMNTRYESYKLSSQGKPSKVEGAKIYELMHERFGKRPLRKLEED